MHLLLHKVDIKRKTKTTEEKVQQILGEQLGEGAEGAAANLVRGCSCKFDLDSNDEMKHPESAGR